MSKRDENWVWKPGDVKVSPCMTCLHAHPRASTCDAFPDGIPMPILLAEHDHQSPYPGDNGIQYERAAEAIPPEN